MKMEGRKHKVKRTMNTSTTSKTKMPVKLPILAAGRYFDGAVFDHSAAFAENSNLVIKFTIPNFFNISPALVSCLFNVASSLFVSLTIYYSNAEEETSLESSQGEKSTTILLIA
jgi:hypothetical protein